MLNLILDSIFFGFAIYSIAKIIFSFFINSPGIIFNESVDKSAVITIRITGIIFFIFFVYNLISEATQSDFDNYLLVNRIFGPYWFVFWIYLFAYFGLTQLLWIRRIIKSKFFRLLIALFILLAYAIDKIIYIITSLNRDYFPGSWAIVNGGFTGNLMLNWMIELIIFIIAVWITNLLLKKKLISFT